MSPSGSPAPWGGCWPRTARGGSPAPPTSSGPCNPSRPVPTWRSWPGPRRGRRLNEMLPTTYSVLRGCDFPRIHVRLSWSARVDLPSKRQWWAGSKLPPFRRAHVSALRPSISLHPKPSLVVTLSAAARTQTEALRRQDMLPLGHQLSIGLAHRADAAVQVVPAQWIDGILAPVVPSPFLHRLSLRQAEQL